MAVRPWQRVAVELKGWRDGDSDPTPDGLEQLDAYLDRLDLDHGTLVIFDRRRAAPAVNDRIAFTAATTPGGRAVSLLRA